MEIRTDPLMRVIWLIPLFYGLSGKSIILNHTHSFPFFKLLVLFSFAIYD